MGRLLVRGRNALAVLVQDIGIGTFQYIAAAPGLIAELRFADARGARRIATDGAWRATLHAGFAWPVPRIGCQQGWEEQVDARRVPAGWREPAFVDDAWPAAAELAAPPHRALEARAIPPLTADPVLARRVVAVEAVRPAPYTLSLDLRPRLDPHDRTANYLHGRLLAATWLWSARAQEIEVHQPHGGRDCAVKLGDAVPRRPWM